MYVEVDSALHILPLIHMGSMFYIAVHGWGLERGGGGGGVGRWSGDQT